MRGLYAEEADKILPCLPDMADETGDSGFATENEVKGMRAELRRVAMEEDFRVSARREKNATDELLGNRTRKKCCKVVEERFRPQPPLGLFIGEHTFTLFFFGV